MKNLLGVILGIALGAAGLSIASSPPFNSPTRTVQASQIVGTLAVANGGTGITSLGTGVATALGVNVGSAGAVVVNGGALGTPSSGTIGAGLLSLGQLTNSVASADVAMNNTSNYFDGPSVAQGTTGTWFASGAVTVLDTAGAATIYCKLWDGTTIIASGAATAHGASTLETISLSGYLASPAGNIRISCRDITSTSGQIKFNATSNSKDSTISAYRIN